MAQEITSNVSLAVVKAFQSLSISVSGQRADMAGTRALRSVQSIPTTAGGTAIKLGDLASVAKYQFVNLDATNSINLMTAVAGTVYATLLPGETHHSRFSSGITAPAAIGVGGACLMDILICET